MIIKAPTLYQQYFIDKNDERKEMFKQVHHKFKIESVLYPGSFVHITPSFYFTKVIYIDTDKRCNQFYSDPQTLAYINFHNKNATFKFFRHDFSSPFEEIYNTFDLLISQYAGFISKHCSDYLKKDGYLLVNDSHGDATLAHLSNNYQLVATFDNQYTFNKDNLEDCFTFTRNREIELDKVLSTMKGPKYKHMPFAYLFQKII